MENHKRVSYGFFVLFWIAFLCSPGIIVAQSSVGYTPLSVDVSDIGAATCQMNIAVPPGTNGVEPNISIVYNSHSQMGILGWGWHLSGLSSICRVHKNRYFDGLVAGIKYDQTDRFALDGERMLLINTIYTYGGNRVEYGLENEDFTRVVSYTSNGMVDYFEVITGEGTVMEYRAKAGTSTSAYAYYISKLTDPNGNYMNFSYFSINDELLIDSISYTGNTAANTTPYNSVKFKYKDIGSYENVTYITGVPFKQGKLLEEISIRSEGEQIRRYIFEYKMSLSDNLYPFLFKVTEYGRNGEALNPIQIQNPGGDIKYKKELRDTASDADVHANYRNRCFIAGDFDGDKRGDYATVRWGNNTVSLVPHLSTGTLQTAISKGIFKYGGSSADYFEGYDLAVIDYENKDEIILAVRKLQYGYLDNRVDSLAYLYLKWNCDSNKLLYKTIKKGNFPFSENGGEKEFKIANIDNNSNLDFIAVQRIRLYPADISSKIVGFNVYVLRNFCEYEENHGWTNLVTSGSGDCKIEVIDYDGDGLSEVLVIKERSTTVYKYYENTNSFRDLGNFDGLTTKNDTLVHFGDFNGDGISDILKGTETNSPFSSYYIRLGTGKGFSDVYYTNVSDVSNAQKIYLMDVNNDGKTDIVYKIKSPNSTEYTLIPSLTIGFNNYGKHVVRTITNIPYTDGPIPDYSPMAFLDFNGDGTMDFIYWRNINNFSRPRNYLMLFQDDNCLKVQSITESMGVKHIFQYAPIQFNSRFRMYKNHIRYVLNTVKRYRVETSPNVLIHDRNYVFSNSYYDHKRQSFLGFFNVTITDNVSETKDVVSYTLVQNALALRKGSVLTSKTQTDTDTQIGRHTLNVLSMHLGNSRYAIYPESSTITDYIKSSSKNTKTFLSSTGKINRTSTTFYNLKNVTGRYKIENEYYYTTKPLSNGKTVYKIDSSIHQEAEDYGRFLYMFKNVLSYTYDTKGNISRTVDNADGKVLQTDFSYNSFGLPVQKTISGAIAGSRKENYGYDTRGRFMTSKATHYNHTENWTYDKATGNPLTYTDINNNTVDYRYDGWGRLISTTLPDGYKDSLTYTWASVPSWIGADAKYTVNRFENNVLVESNYYDVLNREVLYMKNGIYTQTNYNTKGLVSAISMPFNSSGKAWTTYGYDLFDRVVSQNGPYTNLGTTYSVDPYYEPYTETITDNIRNTFVSRTYSVYGTLQKVVDAAGELSYEYKTIQKGDAVVKQTRIKLNNAHTTIIEEDMHGNRLLLSDPDAGTITSQYNEFNELISQTDANGTISEYEYDSLGRILQCTMTAKDSNVTMITYTYDANNKKGILSSETITPDNTSITYTYNNLAQLTGKTYHIDNQTLSFMYGYNNKGQVQDITYPHGFAIRQEYDGYGRLSEISRTDQAMPLYKVKSFSLGEKPNSVVMADKMGTVSHYDITGRLMNRVTGKGNLTSPGNNFILQDTSLQYMEYEYDGAGRMIERIVGNVFIMNEFNQQTLRKSHQTKDWFQYDKSDRLINAKGEYVTGILGIAYGEPYYAYVLYKEKEYFNTIYNQNVISENYAFGEYSYTSSKPHALTEIKLLDSNSISLNQCDLTYTAFNKAKTINEGDYKYEIKYLPNRQRAVAVLEENGLITEKKIYTDKTFEQTNDKRYFYVYAYGQPVAVFIQEGNNNIQPYFIHTDHLGSVDIITDGNGTIVDQMSFDVWGNRRSRFDFSCRDSITHLIDRGFTMHQHLDVFKLINMNGRMYDPVVQQFLSPDPYVQMPDNPLNYNRYSYALNNPLHWTDPTGYLLDEWDMDIRTGKLTWRSDLGGDITHYVNIIDGENFYGQYSFPAQNFSVNWNKDEFGDVTLSIFGGASSWNMGLMSSTASFFQKFTNTAGMYFDGIAMSSYAAGIPSYTYSSFYQPIANGRTDYSPFNVGDLIGIGSAVKGLASLASTAFSRIAAKTGTYSVYQGLDAAASVRYVGITSRNPTIRFAEHAAAGGQKGMLLFETQATGLSRSAARVMEQNLINQYGLQKNGGLLFNRINSIAPKFWWQYGIK